MALTFPLNNVLDNFNRSNEGPPMTGWTDLFTGFKVSSNAAIAATSGSSFNVSDWANTNFGPDCEVFATVSTKLVLTNDQMFLFLGLDSSLFNGYVLSYVENTTGTDIININRFDGGAATTLASFNQEVSAGDSIGLSRVGSKLSAYYKSGAGAWTLLGTATDSTYSASGKIGIGSLFTAISGAFDNFGGGALKIVSPSPLSLTSNLPTSAKAISQLPSPLTGTFALVPSTRAGSSSKTVNVSPLNLSISVVSPTKSVAPSIAPLNLTSTLVVAHPQPAPTFPSTAIFDTFNRSNEGPPMTNWSDFLTGWKVVSNAAQMSQGSGVVELSYWNPNGVLGTYGPNAEVYGTLAQRAGTSTDETNLGFDFQGNVTGYFCTLIRVTAGTDLLCIERRDPGGPNYLIQISQNVAVGDSIGMQRVGTLLLLWYKAAAGQWTLLATMNDSTYIQNGVLCLVGFYTTTSGAWDSIGGGTILAPGDALFNAPAQTIVSTLVAPTPTGAVNKTVIVAPLAISTALIAPNKALQVKPTPLSITTALISATSTVQALASALAAAFALQTGSKILNVTANPLAATLAMPGSTPMVITAPGAQQMTLLLNPVGLSESSTKTVVVGPLSLSISLPGVLITVAISANPLVITSSMPTSSQATAKVFNVNALSLALALGASTEESRALLGPLSLTSLLGGTTPQSLIKPNAQSLTFVLTNPAIALAFNNIVIVAPLNLIFAVGAGTVLAVYKRIRSATHNQQQKNTNKINAQRRISRANAIKNQTHSGL